MSHYNVLSPSLSLSLSLSLSTYLSIYPSVYVSIYLPIYLSIYIYFLFCLSLFFPALYLSLCLCDLTPLHLSHDFHLSSVFILHCLPSYISFLSPFISPVSLSISLSLFLSLYPFLCMLVPPCLSTTMFGLSHCLCLSLSLISSLSSVTCRSGRSL